MNPLLKNLKKHIGIKRKHEEEMKGVHDNVSALMHLNVKKKINNG